MKAAHVCMTWLGVLWLLLLAAAVVDAQAPLVTLTVMPNTVTLASGETAETVVAAQVSNTTVQSITLSAFSDAGVDITINDSIKSKPPLRGALVWHVAIKRSSTGHPTGKIYFRADYQLQEQDGQLIPGLVMTALDIQERLADALDKVITPTLETAIDTLQDRQSQQVFLIVKNIATVPVTVTRILPAPIPYITIEVVEPLRLRTLPSQGIRYLFTEGQKPMGSGVRLEPQQSYPFLLKLTAGDIVQPGKSLLVIQIDIAWEKAGLHTTGSAVLSKNFTVGVFGESAILGATAIPSVMLLPGFLFVATLILLVKWSWRLTLLDLDFKKPEFWLAAITVSLVIIVLYPVLTGPFLSWLLRRPMPPRDYLQGYGFNDILIFWLGAILLGMSVWTGGSVLVGLYKGIRRALKAHADHREREQRAMLIPVRGDLPQVILQKIANNQQDLNLKQVQYSKGNTSQSVFVLPSGFPEPGKIWIAPPMRLSWRTADRSQQDKIDRLSRSEHSDDLRRLIDILRPLQDPRAPAVTLDWDRSGSLVTQVEQVEEDQTAEVTAIGNKFFN